MASLNSIYIKREKLEELLKVLDLKKENGIELTISIADEGNNFDQNVSAYVSQTKEQREAKKPRYYVGNGRTFWTDGKIQVIQKGATPAQQVPVDVAPVDDLPF